MTPELEAVLRSAQSLRSEDVPHFVADLVTIVAVAWSRLNSPAPAPAAQLRDELLDVDEAAKRLQVSADYLYRHWKKLPFAQKYHWGLRFSARGLDQYIHKHLLSK